MGIFFGKSNNRAGGKVLKMRTISDNFGSEFALCTISDDMYTLLFNNKSCFQCSSFMCLFRENGINKQNGQNPKIKNKQGRKKQAEGAMVNCSISLIT